MPTQIAAHSANVIHFMMEIDEIISNIYPLPASSSARLIACTDEISCAKGSIVISTKRIEDKLFFIKKGIVRAYADHNDAEVTFWFGQEGDAALSIMSYVAMSKSYENIETLEDCQLYQLKTEKLQRLYTSDIHVANWGRKLMEREWVKTEARLISMQCKSASARYKELIENTPDLLQRVKLTHIASYLGITLVSLSRIRADFGK